MNVEAFFIAYVEAALWSSADEHGESLEDNYSEDDLCSATLAKMREDCEDFIKANEADLKLYIERMKTEEYSGEALAGHDFWLTRNGHGAGFWDRGLGELGKRLTEEAKVYNGFDLYVSEGKVYGS